MGNDKIIRSVIEKCDIFYDDALLSKENIMQEYLVFFARQFNPDERSVSFAFHTGSLCFNVVSLAALMVGCLAYYISSNDEILQSLETNDMVIFKGERYRWGGIEKMSCLPEEPAINYIVLKQDGKGKNGNSTRKIPYELNKHIVKPYYGKSSVTDGRGIRRDTSNRNDFISYILDIPVNHVPSTLDISVVVVADKDVFIEICKHLRIRYKDEKYVELPEIVPVSYYTSSGEQFQIGKNPAKAEAVIKVTGKTSMARNLVLDKHKNRVIGLLVTNHEFLTSDSAELNDLLRRKTLKFASVITPFNAESCELVMDQYESAKIFACTKDLLSITQHAVKSDNKLTRELNRQISNILIHETHSEKIESLWSWEEFRTLKEKLYAIKHSNWSGEDRDNFILSAIALINLFSTAFFSMETMEKAVADRKINSAVVSPRTRLTELENIAERNSSVQEKCKDIVSLLLEKYNKIFYKSPKGEALLRFLNNHQEENLALVVPKSYYTELFSLLYQREHQSVNCITVNRFDRNDEFDHVIAIGDISGKRFDPLQCFSAPNISLFLYEHEERTFAHRRRKSERSEKKLNARIKELKGDEYTRAVKDDAPLEEIQETTIREFSDLDDFVESMSMLDIRRWASSVSDNGGYSTTSEVKYVGTFVTGEQILFSRYYSAVVFDQSNGKVIETSPDKLVPGDILVFTKKNGYTSNIVDQIFDQLMSTKKLNATVQDAAEKAFYWKEILREYKDNNGLTYSAIAKLLKKLGSSLQEVTIRQWLIEESHIVGPRDANTMEMIAALTQDPYLLRDPIGYFEACRTVRHYRREILSLIAEAINNKLSNKDPAPGSAFEVVFENIDKLSETMELENVFELDEFSNVNNSLVNRPITKTEVLM